MLYKCLAKTQVAVVLTIITTIDVLDKFVSKTTRFRQIEIQRKCVFFHFLVLGSEEKAINMPIFGKRNMCQLIFNIFRKLIFILNPTSCNWAFMNSFE